MKKEEEKVGLSREGAPTYILFFRQKLVYVRSRPLF